VIPLVLTTLLILAAGLGFWWWSQTGDEAAVPAISLENANRIAQFAELMHDKPVYAIAFSADGRQLASGTDDGRIFLWDTATGSQLRLIGGHYRKPVHALDFSADGRWLLSAAGEGKLRLWDLRMKKIEAIELASGSGENYFAVFSADGGTALSGGDGGAVLWDLNGFSVRQRLDQGMGFAVAGAYRPDGDSAVIALNAEDLVLWDLSDGNMIREFDGGGRPGIDNADVYDLTLAADGETVFAIWESGCIVRWNSRSGEADSCWAHAGGSKLSVNRRTDLLAIAGRDAVSLMSQDGIEVRRLTAHQGRVTSARFSRDGILLASAGIDGTVRLWAVAAP
jgi:WD40 repeat protein